MIELAELIKAIFLGIVEGITEFLPISSTGHLIVASALVDFRANAGGTFEIFIQLGAVLAVVWFYRAELLRQVRNVGADESIQRLWLAIVIAVIPAGVMGFLLRDWIKNVLFSPTVVAMMLIIGGVILIMIERGKTGKDTAAESSAQPERSDLTRITMRQALIVGIAQTIALIPGVSRSAASIIGGMFTGLDRRTATEFSFLLAIPTLGGATIADLLFSLDEIQPDEFVYLAVGLVVSAVVAWLAIRWLLGYVARHNFVGFGVYRILAGTALLLLVAAGML